MKKQIVMKTLIPIKLGSNKTMNPTKNTKND